MTASDRHAHDSHPELPLDPDAAQPGVYVWPPHLTPLLQITVFAGGCFGALARYETTLALPSSKNSWPMATFLANLVGAFLLGFLLESLVRRGADKGPRRVIRLGLGTGFMGAFTTYSTFAVEVVQLIRHQHIGLATLYASGSLIGGILCAGSGIWVAAAHHKRRARSRA